MAAALRVMSHLARSTFPKMAPISGMITLLIRVLVMLPKAVAMITPTAMSSTLPRMMNSLNSFAIFFMGYLSFLLF